MYSLAWVLQGVGEKQCIPESEDTTVQEDLLEEGKWKLGGD